MMKDYSFTCHLIWKKLQFVSISSFYCSVKNIDALFKEQTLNLLSLKKIEGKALHSLYTRLFIHWYCKIIGCKSNKRQIYLWLNAMLLISDPVWNQLTFYASVSNSFLCSFTLSSFILIIKMIINLFIWLKMKNNLINKHHHVIKAKGT